MLGDDMELELSIPPNLRELGGPTPAFHSDSGEEQRLVTFYIGETLYAIPASLVAEVGPRLSPTTLPDSPLYVAGVTSHRGEVLALIDLRNGVGELTVSQNPKARSLILRNVDAEAMQTAFNVDRVSDLRSAAIDASFANGGISTVSINGVGTARVITSEFLDSLLTKTLEN